MIINHIEKLFVTNDAATILNELCVSKYLFSFLDTGGQADCPICN